MLASTAWVKGQQVGYYAFPAPLGNLLDSYTNVVGLPLSEVVSLLLGEGFPIHFNWLKQGEHEIE